MAIGERIDLARRIARMSQRALAAKVGVSATAICKYEANKDVPSSRVLIRLAEALGVGIEFFLRPPRVRAVELPVRKRDGMPEDAKRVALVRVQEWLERYLETEELLAADEQGLTMRFEFPNGFPRVVGTVQELETAAEDLREVWDLGRDAIEDITELLEEQGIKVGLIEGYPDFDARTFWAEAEDRMPVIAAQAHLPGDRQRFSLACELAHLLLSFPDDWSVEQTEEAAHRFASALLVPAEAARRELGNRRSAVSLYELHMLKHKYGVSMQVWIDRAKDLGILPEESVGRFLQYLEEGGWKTTEPGDAMAPERPTRLERMIMHALSEELISERRASELLGKSFSQFEEEFAHAHGGLPVVAGH